MEVPAPQVAIPAVAFSCPWCRAPMAGHRAGEGIGPRACSQCGRRTILVSGAAGDPGVRPYDPREHRGGFKVKVPGLFLMQQVELEPTGFAWGDLDPIIGVARMSSTRVQFPQVVSLAVWRSINWLRLGWNVLVGLPLTVSFAVLTVTESPAWLFALVPVALLNGLGIYGSLMPGVLRFRIVTTQGDKEVKLRRGGRKAKRFALEALRRVTSQPADGLP